jgi:uncharacterized protein (TIGR02231 family)
MPTAVDAPIVAVTVYPQQARVTRRGRARLGGDGRYAITGLPPGLRRESVRVGGSGPAAIAGVDITDEQRPRSTDPVAEELRERQRAARARLDEARDAVAVQDTRSELLGSLSRRSGGAFAKALAEGGTEPDRVAGVADALAGQLGEVLGRRRELARHEEELAEELAAVERSLEARQAAGEPDRVTVTVELEREPDAPEDAEAELELSYVVTQASWESGYDIRLRGDRVSVTWHGMVTQDTGEDWPACELALSTARPAATVGVPELEPWFLDRVQPAQPVRAARPPAMAPGSFGAPESHAAFGGARDLARRTAEIEQGATAATYRPGKPVAVPSDAAAHRTRIADLDLAATLDYITAPVRGEDAYLRAVVTNDSAHTLRPGRASVFHDNDFAGTTRLGSWAPGEEVELALGVDDRIRIDRELVRRTASKGTLSGTRRREAEYRTTITNHTPRRAEVTVLDQVPVSRDDAIMVRDVRCTPEPAERTDLGEVTWRLALDPEETAEITLAFRVDAGRGVELSGWRE